MVGIRLIYQVAANVVIASSAALQTVGLTSPIAANQTQQITIWQKFSVGATGGIRWQLVVPAAGTLFELSYQIFDTVTPAQIIGQQAATAVFTNALAVAGTHWLQIDATIINGATAGNVDFQMAQNTSDVLPLTVFRGGRLETVNL